MKECLRDTSCTRCWVRAIMHSTSAGLLTGMARAAAAKENNLLLELRRAGVKPIILCTRVVPE